MILDFPDFPTSGELFTASNGISYRYDGVKWISIGLPPSGDNAIEVGETAPASIVTGTLWFNTTDARLYVKYDDQWVDASPIVLPQPEPDIEVQTITFNDQSQQTTAWTGSALTINEQAPQLSNGSMWFNSTDARLYVRYEGQWVDASPIVLPQPEPDIEVQTITFNDQSQQTTAWTGSALTIDEQAPQLSNGAMWFSSTDARLYVRYEGQWVDASPVILPQPEPDIEVQTITFNDQSQQTTAWTGTVSWSDITDLPDQLAGTLIDGGNATSWLTPV